MQRKASLFYWTLWSYLRTVFWFFYRKWQVHGAEHIPKNAAVIYVANHQNAFLDALLLTCNNRTAPWFLTRAGVFNSKFARFLFHKMHMLPVYRFRDGIKGLRNNEITMRQSADLLNQKQTILLFGEGDQDMRWILRNMQKGFARIAWMVQQENNWELPLYIVPVGIQYDHYFDFRSRVLVNYGKSIAIDASYRDMPEREFLTTVVHRVREAVKPLMLDIPLENYKSIETVIKHDRSKRDLLEQLQHDQHIADTWAQNPIPVKPKSKNFLLLLVTLPMHIYTWANNIVAYSIVHFILNKYVSREFRGSLKIGLGMVLVPLLYGIQSIIVQCLVHDWRITLAYLLTLPFITSWSVDIWNKGMAKV